MSDAPVTTEAPERTAADRRWRRLGVELGKQWKIVVAVIVVLTGVLAIGLTRVEFATGQDSYLNPDSQIAIDNVEFQDQFGGETIILLFTAAEGSEDDVASLYADRNLDTLVRITDELSAIDAVSSVITPLTSLNFSAELVGGPAGTQALSGALGRDPDGAAVRSSDIQISLARRTAAGEQVIGNPAWNDLLIFGNDNFEIVDGQVVAPDRSELVVRKSLTGTFPNAEGSGLPLNSTAVAGVVLDGNIDLDTQSAATEAVLAVLDTASFDGFDLTVTGSPVYLAEINDYLQGGMLTLGLAALVVMAVVLGLIFQVRWRLLPLLAVLIGVVWAFSLMGWLGIDLSLVTISGLPILIGLGIDFAIQIHNRVEEEVVLDRDDHPISETVANVAPALIVATIAGVLAFLALRISKVPMIRDFGVLLAIGVVVLVAIGIIVPVAVLGAREWNAPTSERGESAVEKLVVKLGGLPSSAGIVMVVAAIGLFVGGVLVEGQTKIQSDPVEWIDQGSQTVADIETLETSTGFGTTLGVLVTANNIYDQSVVTMLHEFIIDAEARPDVVSSSSLVNTMAKVIDIDGATVIEPTSNDIVNAVSALQVESRVELLDDIERALVNEDGTATQLNLRLAPASLEERSVLVDELAADLEARIDVLAADLDTESILLTDLPEDQDPVRAVPAGLATVGIGLLENLSANRANLTYLALALAGLWLVLRFRSLTRALLALVPVLLAVGVSSLIVALVGFELSPLTTVGGPLVIATCAEFSVLILGRYLEERQRGLAPRAATDTAASRTGRAFFTSALTTIGGFAVLIGSALPLLRDFGIIVTLNVAIALLAALVVMPPLSVWVDERGWLGTQAQQPTAGTDAIAAVKLAAVAPGPQTVAMGAGAVAFAAAGVGVFAAADTDSGEASDITYTATPFADAAPAAPDPADDEPAEEPAEDEAAEADDAASAEDDPAEDATDDDAAAADDAPAEDDAPTGDAATDDATADEPVDDVPAEDAAPAIDPSTFPADPPSSDLLLESTLFGLLVGGGDS
ncbi:MAG: MMPL family transporter, partial [Actinomycetota bacterium]